MAPPCKTIARKILFEGVRSASFSGNNTDKCPVEGHIPNLFVISLLIGIEYNTKKFITNNKGFTDYCLSACKYHEMDNNKFVSQLQSRLTGESQTKIDFSNTTFGYLSGQSRHGNGQKDVTECYEL